MSKKKDNPQRVEILPAPLVSNIFGFSCTVPELRSMHDGGEAREVFEGPEKFAGSDDAWRMR